MGLAYLLARASDTVADTRLLPRAERLRHLATLSAAYAGAPGGDPAALARACAPLQTHAAERELLERIGEALSRVDLLPAADRTAVRTVLATITEGQRFDLERFPGEDASTLAALDTLADLDRYTYLVAGCVGEFWTRVHVAHRPRLAGWDVAAMSATGVRFGKALQLTNVLRDVPADLRHGRCYLPARELAPLGLAPSDLLDPARTPAARRLLDRLLREALEHYAAGLRVASADRARHARRDRAPPESARRGAPDQDLPRRCARDPGALVAHRVVGRRAPPRGGPAARGGARVRIFLLFSPRRVHGMAQQASTWRSAWNA